MQASCAAARSCIPDASYQGFAARHSVCGTNSHSSIHRVDVRGSFQRVRSAWPPRLDVNQVDLAIFSPAQHAPRCELRSVVGTHTFRLAATFDQPIQLSRNSTAAQAGVSLQHQTLARERIDHTRMRIILPFASPSTMKSIAHSWFARIRRGSITCSRTSRLRRRRRTAKPCSAYSR